MENKEFYQFLLARYADGSATEDELNELFNELNKREHEAEWAEIIDQVISLSANNEPYDERYWDPVIQQILSTKQVETPVRRLNTKRWWVAASVIILASVALYLLYPLGKQSNKPETSSRDMLNIVPGKQGAILTLADNSQVLLDTLKNGTVLTMEGGGNARVVNGNLVYGSNGSDVTYNTVTTPNGRQYRIELPDGTLIWLNAGSSVRYPTAFTGAYRVVRITGEAYLEVAKNPKMPFRVDLNNNISLQVLGTSFNVNAYDDEPFVKTTLLEGSVRVDNNGQAQKLVPGQQAAVNEKINVTKVDVQQVIAWKNGLFDFNNKDVKSALREIARWYDLSIVYESEPASGEIVGKMQRNLALSQVMETLSDLDIHYRIEGRKLIVSK